MSELGEIIVDLIHLHRDNMAADEMSVILVELNDVATKRKRVTGHTDLNDAILEWARDNFQCRYETDRKLEWL